MNKFFKLLIQYVLFKIIISQSIPQLNNVYNRKIFYLNEKWNYIIDLQEEGYYDYTKSKIKGDYKLNGKKYFSVAELEIYQFDFFE